VFALSFALGLLLLDLSGAARGEVARVWAFLVPLPLLASVGRLPRRRVLFIVLVSLLSLHLFVANIFVRYIGTDLSDPPAPPAAARSVAPDARLATWEEGISLQSAQVPTVVTSGQPLTVHATWTTSRQVNRPYTVFVHLYDPQGTLVTQRDVMPLEGRWPTTCWRPGESLEDSYTMVVPDSAEMGSYRLLLGLYWLPSGERLTLDGQSAQTVDIGTTQVRETSEN
jgi:hypothetical protein